MTQSEKYRTKVIELHDKKGMTFPAIAEKLGLSLSTTYNIYRYGSSHGKKKQKQQSQIREPQKRLYVYQGKKYWDISDYFLGV